MLNLKKWIILLFLLLAVFLSLIEPLYSDQKVYKTHNRKIISGNSGKIIFSAYIKGSWQIWSLNPEGGNLSQITHTPQDVHSPALSYNNDKLAYATNEGEIWILEEGQKLQKILTPSQKCAHPAWSPDGIKIAFVCFSFINGQEESDIWITNIKEKRYSKLFDAFGIQKDPEWSPDGKSIVYVSGYWNQSGGLIEELWVWSIESNNKRPLIVNDACNIHPSWSPDGEWIAFASDKTGNMEIWVINRFGKNDKQLTRNKAYDADPCWSPDGAKICFASTRGGKMDIWLMDKDGKNVRQLTNVSEGDCKDPYWR